MSLIAATIVTMSVLGNRPGLGAPTPQLDALPSVAERPINRRIVLRNRQSSTGGDRSSRSGARSGMTLAGRGGSGGSTGGGGGGGRLRIPVETPTRPSGADSQAEAPAAISRFGDGVRGVTWSNLPESVERLEPMVWLKGNRVQDEGWTGRTYFQPDVLAEELKSIPVGERSIHPWRYRNAFLNHPLDRVREPDGRPGDLAAPFLEHASQAIRAEMEVMTEALYRRGASIDRIIGDVESYGEFSSWALPAEHIDAIMQDPRFSSWQLSNGTTPAEVLGNLTSTEIKRDRRAAAVWNALTRRLFAEAIERAIIEPVAAWWPDVEASNYGHVKVAAEHAVPNLNGFEAWSDANVGDHGGVEAYGRLNDFVTRFRIDPRDSTAVTMGTGQPIPFGGWTSLQLEVNRQRAVARSSDDPFHLWIAAPSWEGNGDWKTGFQDSPYHAENIRHQFLLGADLLIYWNPIWNQDESLAAREARHAESLEIDGILKELDEVLRGAPRVQPLGIEKVPWDASVIVAGAALPDGSSIWRISASPDVESIQLEGESSATRFDSRTVGRWIARPDLTPPVVESITRR